MFKRIAASVAAAFMLLGVVTVTLEFRRRQHLYWYDTGADYRFQFMGAVERVPVRVTKGGFLMPAWSSPWYTALLRLRVSSTVAGRWVEPFVEVRSDAGECSQYFERGAAGQRYVNLCLDHTAAAPGQRVQLTGAHLGWEEQLGELLLFPNPVAAEDRLLVVAPHPDDAEIAAFGLYANRDSWIVTVTNGSYGGAPYQRVTRTIADADRLQADLRLWDSVAAPAWAGLPADRAINLGYFTQTLEQMHRDPGAIVANLVTGDAAIDRWRRAAAVNNRVATSSWRSVVADLAALLLELQPDVIVAPHPAFDGNPDHIFTAAAVLEALQQVGDPSVQLLLYTNHHVHSEYYPFGPATALVTLPPWFDSSVPVSGILSHQLSPGAQNAKLFALDAMHDLRGGPTPVVGGVAARLLDRVGRAGREILRDPASELSYFRRAVRPNELFFLYSTQDRERLQRMVRARVPNRAGDS